MLLQYGYAIGIVAYIDNQAFGLSEYGVTLSTANQLAFKLGVTPMIACRKFDLVFVY